MRGLAVTVLEDCCAAPNPEWHRFSIENILPMGAQSWRWRLLRHDAPERIEHLHVLLLVGGHGRLPACPVGAMAARKTCRALRTRVFTVPSGVDVCWAISLWVRPP